MAESKDIKSFGSALKEAESLYGIRFNPKIGRYERSRNGNMNARKLYASPDEAAREWSKVHNDESVRLNRELATYIYKDHFGNYFVAPHHLIATESGFLISDLNDIAQRDGCSLKDVVAIAHTHGNEDPDYEPEFFSETEEDGNGDVALSQALGIPIFLMTPQGNFMKYDPKIDEVLWPEDYLP
ncbi:DUF4329 domain-containing protein [uncultured Fibrobacter sp.]|uniref:DUF4329 domain-containing protein n=1 Tax=uncultured Fibrobacter sp. TaxID=261512 RepID=UPI002803ADB7|nr:DUF4329 domain-containing protein [uncultured Fibrobacter sp.]